MNNKLGIKRFRINRIVALIVICGLILGQNVYAADNTVIDRKTFKNVYISSIYIGAEIKEIHADAFINMHDLVQFAVSPDNDYFSVYSNCLYDKDQTTLICVPQGLKGVKIARTCVAVDQYALKNRNRAFRRRVNEIVQENAKRLGVTEED